MLCVSASADQQGNLEIMSKQTKSFLKNLEKIARRNAKREREMDRSSQRIRKLVERRELRLMASNER